MKPQIIATLLIFLLFACKVNCQCQDSTEVSLDDTKSWLISKINSYGARSLPPTKYYSVFSNNTWTIYEIGMNEKFELKDTTTKFEIDIKDINTEKLNIREIGKNGKFGLSINPINGKSTMQSPALGTLNGLGFELIIQSEEDNLDKRLVKAIKHAHCLVSGSSSNKNKQQSKEKF